jgi:hypothetical protein
MADSWTSVQIATLAMEALTPLTVAGRGAAPARRKVSRHRKPSRPEWRSSRYGRRY